MLKIVFKLCQITLTCTFLIVFVLCMSGWTTITMNANITQDGKGRFDYSVETEKKAKTEKGYSLEELKNAGFKLESILSERSSGIKAIKDVESFSQLGESIKTTASFTVSYLEFKKILDQSLLGGLREYAIGFESIQKSKNLNVTQYNVFIPYFVYPEQSSEDAKGKLTALKASFDKTLTGNNVSVYLKFNLNMAPSENNATLVSEDRKSLTWDLLKNDKVFLQYQGETQPMWLIAAIVLIVIIVIVIIVLIVIKMKKFRMN